MFQFLTVYHVKIWEEYKEGIAVVRDKRSAGIINVSILDSSLLIEIRE